MNVLFVFISFLVIEPSFAQVATPYLDYSKISSNPAASVFRKTGIVGGLHYVKTDSTLNLNNAERETTDGTDIDLVIGFAKNSIGAEVLFRTVEDRDIKEKHITNTVEQEGRLILAQAAYRPFPFLALGVKGFTHSQEFTGNEIKNLGGSLGAVLEFAKKFYFGLQTDLFFNEETYVEQGKWTSATAALGIRSEHTSGRFRLEASYLYSPQTVTRSNNDTFGSNFHKETTLLNIGGEVSIAGNYPLTIDSILLGLNHMTKEEAPIIGSTNNIETEELSFNIALAFLKGNYMAGFEYLDGEYLDSTHAKEYTKMTFTFALRFGSK
ncbi:hypothetical protein OAB57_03880 [Bacteriovoracaceae bacterium]|nr:hypothetical protein [Bacteriovoracaceae bacterium]